MLYDCEKHHIGPEALIASKFLGEYALAVTCLARTTNLTTPCLSWLGKGPQEHEGRGTVVLLGEICVCSLTNLAGMDAEREFLVIKKTDICTAAWNHNLAAQDSFIAAVSCSSGRTYLIREGERPYRHSISSSSSVFAQAFAHQVRSLVYSLALVGLLAEH